MKKQAEHGENSARNVLRYLQNFDIEAIENDLPTNWPGRVGDVQYTMNWGDLHHRAIEQKERLEASDDLEDYLLRDMFIKMCLHAWEEAKEANTLVIDRKLASEVLDNA